MCQRRTKLCFLTRPPSDVDVLESPPTCSMYQNCARCHGLEAISGGIAPDLRKLDNDCASLKDTVKKAACVKEMDGYFIGKVRRGVSRNGAVYMPPFDGILQQEAVWAIKSYLETRREKPL